MIILFMVNFWLLNERYISKLFYKIGTLTFSIHILIMTSWKLYLFLKYTFQEPYVYIIPNLLSFYIWGKKKLKPKKILIAVMKF